VIIIYGGNYSESEISELKGSWSSRTVNFSTPIYIDPIIENPFETLFTGYKFSPFASKENVKIENLLEKQKSTLKVQSSFSDFDSSLDYFIDLWNQSNIDLKALNNLESTIVFISSSKCTVIASEFLI